MQPLNIFEEVSEFKEKFKQFFFHKKKLHALENYAQVGTFQHRDYLILIKRCMEGAFLDEKEAEFLCYLAEKYFSKGTYLDWTHKTNWLKNEMERVSRQQRKQQHIQYTLFDMDRTAARGMAVPVEIMTGKPRQIARRA